MDQSGLKKLPQLSNGATISLYDLITGMPSCYLARVTVCTCDDSCGVSTRVL